MPHADWSLRTLAAAFAVLSAVSLGACSSPREAGGRAIDYCNQCHASPPPSGAHAAHGAAVGSTAALGAAYGSTATTRDLVAPESAAYAFGCGNCHPVNSRLHGLGRVELSPAGAPAGSLKARNGAAAAYDSATGTCSEVYCHSSGQATPSFVTTPAWTSVGSLGCGGCHGNPPRYASGGSGAADANSHIGLIEEGGATYEAGHFAGFPAMVHVDSDLGAVGSHGSPITCQSCHFRTADGANTAAGGSYYLDTTGDYDLGGTGSFCFGSETPPCTTPAFSCERCHDGVTAPTGTGRVLPFFHVNGERDVDFDRRAALPGLPARPYWYGPYGLSAPTDYWAIGGDAVDDPTNRILSFSLEGAAWDAGQKRCSNVACHFVRTQVRWGEPLANAGLPDGTCGVCHDN